MKSSSNHLSLDGFSAALIDGLKAELYLTPKPGLVDLSNNGAHPDLTLALMSRSIVMLRSYLKELSAALTRSAQYPELVLIGQQAETRMVRELGSNCHRGGIFLCGLLLVSATRIEQFDRLSLKQAVALTAADFFASKDGCDSHGNRVREQFPHAGIVDEALRGLPAVFEIVLPTVLDNGIDKAQGIYLAMAKLMQQVEDSTSLYRCGEAGLIHLRKSGEILEACILAGSDPVPLLTGMDRDFRRMNLTMGGGCGPVGCRPGVCELFVGMEMTVSFPPSCLLSWCHPPAKDPNSVSWSFLISMVRKSCVIFWGSISAKMVGKVLLCCLML